MQHIATVLQYNNLKHNILRRYFAENLTAMIHINGIIGSEENQVSLIYLIEQTKKVPENEQIHILINSVGGDVDVAFSMHDYLRSLGRTIITECNEMCASAASILFLAGDKRIAGCPIMIHNPWTSAEGDANGLREAAAWIENCERRIEKFYSEKTGQDKSVLSSLMSVETYMTPAQAVTLGFATEAKRTAMALIINPKNKKMAENKKNQKGFFYHLGKAFGSLGDGGVPEPETDDNPTAYNLELLTEAGEVVTIDREEGEPQVGDNASPDGTFIMPDGSTIVIADGVITQIIPAGVEITTEEEPVELAQLREENETLKAENAKLKATQRTAEDLKALNAIRIGGGFDKVFKGVKSNYTPATRPAAQNRIPSAEGIGGKSAEKLNRIELKKKGA